MPPPPSPAEQLQYDIHYLKNYLLAAEPTPHTHPWLDPTVHQFLHVAAPLGASKKNDSCDIMETLGGDSTVCIYIRPGPPSSHMARPCRGRVKGILTHIRRRMLSNGTYPTTPLTSHNPWHERHVIGGVFIYTWLRLTHGRGQRFTFC